MGEISEADQPIVDLIQQAVTSKSCDCISPEDALTLVNSQACRPGMNI